MFQVKIRKTRTPNEQQQQKIIQINIRLYAATFCKTRDVCHSTSIPPTMCWIENALKYIKWAAIFFALEKHFASNYPNNQAFTKFLLYRNLLCVWVYSAWVYWIQTRFFFNNVKSFYFSPIYICQTYNQVMHINVKKKQLKNCGYNY